MQLSKTAARNLMVAAQGLASRPAAPASKAALLATIKQMGALQIDTIHVVARSPYLVLFSRLGSYPLHWLEELLSEGALFEYWAHEACFLPIEDYPLFRDRMLNRAQLGWKYSQEWVERNHEHLARVLTHIRERGAVRSADFVRTDGQSGGWWEWKPEKRALEMLFTAGELMVASRRNFQRIYDLRERVLPDWDDTQLPAQTEAHRCLILKAVRALGITITRWIADYFRMERRGIGKLINGLVDEGLLLPVEVEGWDEAALIHPDNHALATAASEIKPQLTTLLSPFDPLVWDRARAEAVFNFSYRIECYTPAPKRQYGYFTLPILWRGDLIGRLDPKAHRKEGIFEVKALYLEPGIKLSDELIDDLSTALIEIAAWHKTPEIIIRQSDPIKLAGRVQKAIKSAQSKAEPPRKSRTAAKAQPKLKSGA